MTSPHDIKTIGVVHFGGDTADAPPLFQVSPGVPLAQALEHVSNLLDCAKRLGLEAAMQTAAKPEAWAAFHLCEMSKAVVDDLSQGLLVTSS